MGITTTPLAIPDVLLIEPEVFSDERGNFFEAWNHADFMEATGCEHQFVQDNQSRSAAGVVRGLHYQLPRPQGKLVRVLSGSAFTAAVDLRKSSPTFGRAVSAELSEGNHLQLWLPPGFAHGFMALDTPTEVVYKVTDYFDPGCDRAIRWDDPVLGIDWPLSGADPVISERDGNAPLLRDIEVYP